MVGANGAAAPHAAVETFTYLEDGSGRVETYTLANGGVVTYGYGGADDPFGTGLPTSVTRPGHTLPAKIRYDRLGHVTAVAQPGRPYANRVLYWDYRLSEIQAPPVDGVPSNTLFEYDPDSNRTAMTDPRGNRTTFAYDRQGRGLSTTQPGGAFSATRAFDVSGNLRKSTDFRGNASAFAYDDLNRLTQQVLPGPPARVANYDAYDADGNLTQMSELGDADSPTRVTRYRYDARGNRTHVIRVGAGTPQAPHLATRDAYDAKDRLTQSVLFSGVDPQTGDGGAFVSGSGYAYDGRDRRTALTQAMSLPGGVPAGPTTLYGYAPGGNLRKTTDPDGVDSWTVYDASDRPILSLADDTRVLSFTQYTEDDSWRRLTRSRIPPAPILVPDQSAFVFNRRPSPQSIPGLRRPAAH